MKNILPAILLITLMLSLPVTGCLGGTAPETSDGTEVELGEPLDDWPTYHVPSASNLPTCPGANDENLGKLYYVEDVTEFQACASGGWETVDFSTPLNHPPRVVASIEADDDSHLFGGSDPSTEWMYRGILMWSAVDPEGEAVSVGVDHDRDGVVDVQLPRAEGRIANETTGMLAIPWNGSIVVERVAEYGEGCHLSFTRFFDVIATDDSGQVATYTVQTGAIQSDHFYRNLMDAEDVEDGIVGEIFGNYVTQADEDWVAGVSTDSNCPGLNSGSQSYYLFDVVDASDSVSSSQGDELAYLIMTQGNDINYAALKIQINIDGSAPIECHNDAVSDGSEDCLYSGPGGNTWSVGQSLIIKEGATSDLCSANCDIDVQITNTITNELLSWITGILVG